jgi:hypothetical protein
MPPITDIRCDRFADPSSFRLGLDALRLRGVTPRGLLFLSLEPSGAIHVGSTPAVETTAGVTAPAGSALKVGDKLGLTWPLPGRFFHFDSVHRLRSGYYLFNGDRRLVQPGNAFEVAGLISSFLKGATAPNVFFGCTPHQPGSWIVGGRQHVAVHESGFVEVVPVAAGLIARRVMDHRLWMLSHRKLVDTRRVDLWEPIFESPLGNLLMLERRIIGERLVITCEAGLVELDVSQLPEARERARVPLSGGFGVVGRVEATAFAVTRGRVEPWGLDDIRPATLVGARECSLDELVSHIAGADFPVPPRRPEPVEPPSAAG